MSHRARVRAIAKARLTAMGVPHVNKKLRLGLSHTYVFNMQRLIHGRKQLMKIREQHKPIWRRVTTGSLASDGYRAQMGYRHRRRTAITR